MKKRLTLLIALVFQVLGLFAFNTGDTITLQVKYGGQTYYLIDNGKSGTYVGHTTTLPCDPYYLWVVYPTGTKGAYMFKNLATGNWISSTSVGSGKNLVYYLTLTSEGYQAQVLYLSYYVKYKYGTPNHDNYNSGTVYIVANENKKYYMAYPEVTQNACWKFASYPGTVELGPLRYTKESKFELTATPTEATREWGYEDFMSQNVAMTQKLLDWTYYRPVCKDGTPAYKDREELYITVSKAEVTDATTLRDNYGIVTTVTVTADNTADNGKMSETHDTPDDNGKWTITLTPSTESTIVETTPYRAWTGKVTVTTTSTKAQYADLNYTCVITWIRHTYHTTPVNEVQVAITPNPYLYPQAGGSKTFSLVGNYVKGTRIEDEDGNLYSEKVTSKEVTISSYSSATLIYPTTSESWADITNRPNLPIEVTTQANPQADERTVTLRVIYAYTDDAGTVHHGVADAILNQTGTKPATGLYLQPKIGKANTALSADGRQLVHEVTKDLYFPANKNITLSMKEPALYGWIRWYDYDNNYDLGTGNNIDWVTAPTWNGSTMQQFRTDGLYGRYFRQSMTTSGPTVTYNSPVVRVTDTNEHTVAVDISCYTDYTITSTRIQEPTLSYREIYHLHPVSVMIDSMNAHTNDGSYLEEHVAIVPEGTTMYLTTNYQYNGNGNQQCYYYSQTGSTYNYVGGTGMASAQWYKNGVALNSGDGTIQASTSILIIPALAASDDPVVYTLRAQDPNDASKTYNICQYTLYVQNKDLVGPKMEDATGTAIITDAQIKKDYDVLATLNFNYDKPGYGYHAYDTPLPWAQSSSGFTYAVVDDPTEARSSSSRSYPFSGRGEYGFVNQLTYSSTYNWLPTSTIEQRGGAANGYMLYVDGTQEPGLCVQLSVQAHLCSGQQMYCSAWINNINDRTESEDSHPKLRFEIEGRTTGETEWHSFAQFLTGSIDKTGWQQIVFQVDLKKDYDEYQISMYNFANSSDGNDFVVDDICIFASTLPLVAYQASARCASDNAYTEAVLRVDYQQLFENEQNIFETKNDEHDIYFDIQNTTLGTTIPVLDGYYYDDFNDPNPGASHDNFGRIVLHKEINPTTYVSGMTIEKDSIYGYANIAELLEAYTNTHDTATYTGNPISSGYVRETILNKQRYVLYVINRVQVDAAYDYQVRMAASSTELNDALCVLRTSLPINNHIQLALDGVPQATRNPASLCGNAEYDMAMRLYAIDENDPSVKNEGICLNDWLIVPDEYANLSDEELIDGNRMFGIYTFNQIQTALAYDLRRDETTNTNLTAATLADIDPTNLGKSDSYTIIEYLVKSGLLVLAQEHYNAYIPSDKDTIRFIAMPIVGTGKRLDDPTKSIEMCYEAMPITLTSKPDPNEYVLQMGTAERDSLPQSYKFIPARIRLSLDDAVNQTVRVPVQKIANVQIDDITLVSSTDASFDPDAQYCGYTPDRILITNGGTCALDDYYQDGDTILLTPATTPSGKTAYTMREGFEYTFEIQLLTLSGVAQEGSGCPAGTAYFTLIIVPDYLRWAPTINGTTDWNDDANWVRVDEKGNRIYEGSAYVPLAHSNIILPTEDVGTYPILTDTTSYLPAKYEVGYTQMPSCDKILFQHDTHMQNQDYLQYNKAYVDAAFHHGETHIFTPALRNMYLGDIYMPNDGDTVPGTTVFDHGNAENINRNYPYGFYASFYNTTTEVAATDPTVYGTIYDAEWGDMVNKMDIPLATGQGYAIMGFGPDNLIDGTLLNVRLPKRDEILYYYDANDDGTYTPNGMTTRPTRSDDDFRFAYNPTADGSMSITLKGDQPSTTFVFGNPTLAYIDIFAFLEANGLSTTFRYLDRNGWKTVNSLTATIDDDYMLAPMRGIMVETSTASTSLTVTLSRDMFAIVDGISSSPMNAPRRAPKTSQPTLLSVTAVNGASVSTLTLGESSAASDAYRANEDALMLTSQADNDNYQTPVTLYTIDQSVPMAIDIRTELTTMPLILSYASDDWLENPDTTELWFNGMRNMDHPVYLLDSLTHERTQVYEGLGLSIPNPESQIARYYLVVRDANTPAIATDVPTTSVEAADPLMVNYYMAGNNATFVANYPIDDIRVYDIAGRIVNHAATGMPLTTITLPQGASLIRVHTAAGDYTTKVIIP